MIDRPALRTLIGRKNLVGCEIGVGEGINALQILRELDIKTLYLIDPYERYKDASEQDEAMVTPANGKEHLAKIKLEKYEESRRSMRKENVYEVFTDISMKLLQVVADMEYEGVLLDVPLLDKYSKDYAERAKIKLQEIRDLTKDPTFNPNSPKQLGEKLAVSLAGGRKTATGRISTDEEALEGLVKKGNLLAKSVLELRGLVKTRSTFMEGFKELLDDRGYIHTNYSIAHTVTGRISSNHPNLQNIPRVRKDEANIRAMFTVEEGYSFLAADYAQMEQRIIALLSGDKNLEEIFKNGLDIHLIVTSKILKKDPSLVTHEERAKGKGDVS